MWPEEVDLLQFKTDKCGADLIKKNKYSSLWTGSYVVDDADDDVG